MASLQFSTQATTCSSVIRKAGGVFDDVLERDVKAWIAGTGGAVEALDCAIGKPVEHGNHQQPRIN